VVIGVRGGGGGGRGAGAGGAGGSRELGMAVAKCRGRGCWFRFGCRLLHPYEAAVPPLSRHWGERGIRREEGERRKEERGRGGGSAGLRLFQR